MAENKQNLIAVSDDLLSRIKSLQALYQIDGKDAPIDFILDRAITSLHAELDKLDASR